MQGPTPYVRTVHFVLIALFLTLFAGVASAQNIPTSKIPQTGANRYEREFSELKADFVRAPAPRQSVLLARAFELRDYVDRAADVQDWFNQVSAETSLHPLVQDEATAYLARIDVSTANLVGAERKYVELGFIRKWKISGPFAKELRNAEIEPCTGDSSASGENADGKSAARTVAPGPQPWLDLSKLYSPRGKAFVYATACVRSATRQSVALRLSSDSPAVLFVNGAQVLSENSESSVSFDQHAVAVSLEPGWNTMVLRLSGDGDGPWRFGVRFTRPEGGGLPLNRSTGEIAVASSANGTPGPAQSRPDDLVDMAGEAAQADRGSAEKLETVGLIERLHSRRNSYEHLERAARTHPTARRWLAVANVCPDAPCVLNALTSALRSEPSSATAKIALADYYSGRKQLEKARDLLREAVESAPDDFVARNRLADVYFAAGLKKLALQESRALQSAYANPLWLSRKLAARYTDLGLFDEALPLLTRNLRESFDDRDQRALLVQICQRRHDTAGLQQAYKDAASLDPHDANAIADLAEVQFGNGEAGWAQATMRRTLALNGDRDDLLQRYANMLDRSGQPHEAETQLARALALNPHLENVRRRLESAGDGQIEPEAAYIEESSRLAFSADCTKAADTNAVALADVRVERMYPNGLSSVRVQQVLCIVTEQGARDYASRSVQYSPVSQQLRILHARIHKRNGRVLEAVQGGEAGVADTNIAMYYDVRSREIRYPGLEKGDVVELDYRITPTATNNPYGDYFGSLVVFRSNLPQALKRYVLITPSSRKINIVEARMTAPAQVTKDVSNTIYRWESRNAAALPNEPRGPAVTEIAPYVHASTFGSWDEIGQWYADLVRPQFALDAALKEVSARLTTKKMSEVEKITAIHQFVLRNTHYVAMEFGIYSYKPYPVAQTFARRFGDCKDKASLMIALLREAGIEANIALVRTRRLGDIDERSTSIALFDHAIVYVPKWDLWLDGTAEYAGSRELPLVDQGAMALVVGVDGSSSVRRIPYTQAEDNYTKRSVRAQLKPDGAIEFTGTAQTRGEEAPGLRREYEIPERRRDFFRNSLAEVFPSVHVDEVQVDGTTDLEHDVRVDFRGTLDTFNGRTVIGLAPSWMKRFYVQTLAPLASRTEDLVLPAPWITEEELRFQLPAGASIASIPNDTALATPFGSAKIRYEKKGRELVVSTSVQFSKLRIMPAEYAAFREFCRDLERAFRQEVKVKLPG